MKTMNDVSTHEHLLAVLNQEIIFQRGYLGSPHTGPRARVTSDESRGCICERDLNRFSALTCTCHAEFRSLVFSVDNDG